MGQGQYLIRPVVIWCVIVEADSKLVILGMKVRKDPTEEVNEDKTYKEVFSEVTSYWRYIKSRSQLRKKKSKKISDIQLL